MTRVGRSPDSDWRDGFLFVGDHLALDFLNTCPVQNGTPVELLVDFAALLRWFAAANLLNSRQVNRLRREWAGLAAAHQVTQAMRELRERLRKAVLGWEQDGRVHAGILDELNRLMTEHPMLTRLNGDASTPTTELWFEAHEPEDLFAPLAHSAAMLFAKADRERVRKCARCVLHFHDTSKKGSRRWCSMRLCGNRFKVAAYAARQRAQ